MPLKKNKHYNPQPVVSDNDSEINWDDDDNIELLNNVEKPSFKPKGNHWRFKVLRYAPIIASLNSKIFMDKFGDLIGNVYESTNSPISFLKNRKDIPESIFLTENEVANPDSSVMISNSLILFFKFCEITKPSFSMLSKFVGQYIKISEFPAFLIFLSRGEIECFDVWIKKLESFGLNAFTVNIFTQSIKKLRSSEIVRVDIDDACIPIPNDVPKKSFISAALLYLYNFSKPDKTKDDIIPNFEITFSEKKMEIKPRESKITVNDIELHLSGNNETPFEKAIRTFDVNESDIANLLSYPEILKRVFEEEKVYSPKGQFQPFGIEILNGAISRIKCNNAILPEVTIGGTARILNLLMNEISGDFSFFFRKSYILLTYVQTWVRIDSSQKIKMLHSIHNDMLRYESTYNFLCRFITSKTKDKGGKKISCIYCTDCHKLIIYISLLSCIENFRSLKIFLMLLKINKDPTLEIFKEIKDMFSSKFEIIMDKVATSVIQGLSHNMILTKYFNNVLHLSLPKEYVENVLSKIILSYNDGSLDCPDRPYERELSSTFNLEDTIKKSNPKNKFKK